MPEIVYKNEHMEVLRELNKGEKCHLGLRICIPSSIPDIDPILKGLVESGDIGTYENFTHFYLTKQGCETLKTLKFGFKYLKK